jgi:hypothetical protein
MKIYILGLENGFRGSKLRSLMESHSNNVQIVWGKDGRTEHRKFTKVELVLQRILNGRHISLGEYFCAKGHDAIYQNFLESDSDWALVLEEDVTAMVAFEEILTLATISEKPTIIHLGGFNQVLNSSPHETFWIRNLFTVPSARGQDHIVAQVMGNIFGAYAYLINRSAATIAIHGNRRIHNLQLADWPSTWRSKVSFFLTKEGFFTVDLERSIIEQEREVYKRRIDSCVDVGIRLRILGWVRILLNLTLINPAIRSIVGVNFRSVLHNDLYIYFYSRLMLRIRDAKVADRFEEKVETSGT